MPDLPRVIPHILDQHAEEAAFLWLLRSAAVSEPHYALRDLAHLDDRVEAHLDGLRIGGEPAWDILVSNLAAEEPGEVFAATVLAVESGAADRMDPVFELASSAPELELTRGLVSAIGWADAAHAEPALRRELAHPLPERRAVALRADAVRRRGLALEIPAADWREDPRTHAAMLRGLGELGRVDRVGDCVEAVKSEDPRIRFWAAWAATALGSRSGLDTLRSVAEEGGRDALRALQLAGRAMEPGDARTWQRELASRGETLRLAADLAGVVGDPTSIPWLLDQMSVDAVARVAGEAFSMITGLDLAYHDLDRDAPEDFDGGPSDDPEDENVDMDADENLPWPDPAALAQWWSSRAGDFRAQQRYLAGEAIHPGRTEGLAGILRQGTQRRRAAAALEIKLADPHQPLVEVRAPGWRQCDELGVPRR